MQNKGFGLIFIIILVAALLLVGSIFLHAVFSTNSMLNSKRDNLCAFYLAESAIELGKARVKSNPNWYTDMPHSGNLIKWLKESARGQEIKMSPLAGYKVIKEYKNTPIYGMGIYHGTYAIIKFDNGVWEEL